MIKVLIDRKIKPGTHAEVNDLLIDLRAHAILQKGYITGETLQSREDLNHIVVLSAWHKEADWEAWENDPVRLEHEDKIAEFLTEPEHISIYHFVHTLGSTPPHFSLLA